MLAHTPFRVLLWKESRTLLPFVVVLAIVVTLVIQISTAVGSANAALLWSMTMLFPNLMAFGAPALLVGHEDEVGTLRWQRSLPTSIATLWSVKCLVTLIATLVVAVVCLGNAWLSIVVDPEMRFSAMELDGGVVGEVYRQFVFAVMLASLGFLAGWAFRSPAVGLLVTVPLAVLSVALGIVGADLCVSWWGPSSPTDMRMRGGWYAGHFHLLAAVVAFAASYWSARWRWDREVSIWESLVRWSRRDWSADAELIYAPTSQLLIGSAVGPRRALLWQVWRQTWGIYATAIAILLLIAIQVGYLHWDRSHENSFWVLPESSIIGALLGVATFITDTSKQRYLFLARRGVSRWTIWWTRLLLPIVGLLVSMALIVLIESIARSANGGRSQIELEAVGLAMLLCFLSGLISAMWASRPVVGYLGTAVLLFAALSWGIVVYGFYPHYWWTGIIACFVLLLTTLRMCGRWCDGKRDFGYHGRLVGWMGLSALAAVLPIAVIRWGTMPAAMPQWRAETFALAQQVPAVDVTPTKNVMLYFSNAYVSSNDYRLNDESEKMLREAIADVRSGEDSLVFGATNIPFEYILSEAIPRARDGVGMFAEDPHDWYLGLLELSIAQIRGKLQDRNLHVSDQVDAIELLVAGELRAAEGTDLLSPEEIARLAGGLRTAEERAKQRRNALLVSWAGPMSRGGLASTSEMAWNWPFGASMGGYQTPGDRKYSFYLERLRSWRFIDRATQISLEQLDARLPAAGSAADLQRRNAWADAFGTATVWAATRHWNREFETTVTAARALGKVESEATAP